MIEALDFNSGLKVSHRAISSIPNRKMASTQRPKRQREANAARRVTLPPQPLLLRLQRKSCIYYLNAKSGGESVLSSLGSFAQSPGPLSATIYVKPQGIDYQLYPHSNARRRRHWAHRGSSWSHVRSYISTATQLFCRFKFKFGDLGVRSCISPASAVSIPISGTTSSHPQFFSSPAPPHTRAHEISEAGLP
jgi:hypothetical protein